MRNSQRNDVVRIFRRPAFATSRLLQEGVIKGPKLVRSLKKRKKDGKKRHEKKTSKKRQKKDVKKRHEKNDAPFWTFSNFEL